eukprot:SAG11_NODE_641_length_8008_cov_2.916171_3_plen_100_part_00
MPRSEPGTHGLALSELESVLGGIAGAHGGHAAGIPPLPDGSAPDEEMVLLMRELAAEEERAQRLQVVDSYQSPQTPPHSILLDDVAGRLLVSSVPRQLR